MKDNIDSFTSFSCEFFKNITASIEKSLLLSLGREKCEWVHIISSHQHNITHCGKNPNSCWSTYLYYIAFYITNCIFEALLKYKYSMDIKSPSAIFDLLEKVSTDEANALYYVRGYLIHKLKKKFKKTKIKSFLWIISLKIQKMVMLRAFYNKIGLICLIEWVFYIFIISFILLK